MSVTLYLYAVNSGNLFANVRSPYFIIIAGISQILFYGGIIGVIISFIKLFNKTKRYLDEIQGSRQRLYRKRGFKIVMD